MTQERIQRVRIYLSEHDQWQQAPLYLAVLERLQREGATGATALHGLVGFGPSQHARAIGLGLSDHPPVVIEWIDRADRIARTLPSLNDLLPTALITLEDVQIYQAVLHAHGPFGAEYTAGDIMQASPHTLPPSTSLGSVLRAMLEQRQSTIPILDERGAVVGVITEHELAGRAGLLLPLRLLCLLSGDERAALLQALDLETRPARAIMNHEPRSIYMGAALPQALITMIEWDYEQIVVTNREGTLAGLLSCNAVLRHATEQSDQDQQNSSVRDSTPPTPVQLVMQPSVARVPAAQPLNEALHHLLSTPHRYVVALDDDGHVCGSLSDEDVLRRLEGEERTAWIAALQRATPTEVADLPGGGRCVADLMQHDVTPLAPTMGIIEAGAFLLQHHLERAPVVDGDGTLLGLVGRNGLLRALVQESE
jgi:PII-like signaling protein/Mg/Co/Ni transporter MgtE